jgi:hypothetical protein
MLDGVKADPGRTLLSHAPVSVVAGGLGLVASLAANTLAVERWWVKVLVWVIFGSLIVASIVIDWRKADQKRETRERTEQSAHGENLPPVIGFYEQHNALSSTAILPASDLDKLSDERIQLLRCSVKVLEEMVATSEAIESVTPLSADFDEVSAQMQRSLERTQSQLLALQNDVNVAADWPDGKWAMDFSAARGRAQQKIASLDWHFDRTTASGRSAARPQDIQLRRSIEKLLSLMKKQYPSLFTG